MRDIALTLILIGMMPVSFKRPIIGALMFALISLANPHRMTWGFAYSLPWAMAYAVITMAGLVATREKNVADSLKRYSPVLLYLAWMTVTTVFALEPHEARGRLVEVIKIHTMCLVTLCLLTDWQRVRWLVWVVICSVGFYGLKGGIFTLAHGGTFLVWGPLDSAIEDNNHLAVGLVMMLPMMYWLFTDTRKRWLRWLIVFSVLMTAVSIFGSHSRSAFLGIMAISFFLLLKSRHKTTVAILSVIGAIAIASFMPQEYWNRMETIQTYEEDPSAMGRINTWIAATRLANDRLTGGGFDYYSKRISERYSPDPNRVNSAHSIYFQALGEHGWIGLLLFLPIWLSVWINCRRVIKHAGNTPEGQSQALLARMIQCSILGFAVGGAFINIGNWDMNYYLAIAAMATSRIVTVKSGGENVPARTPPPHVRHGLRHVRGGGPATLPVQSSAHRSR